MTSSDQSRSLVPQKTCKFCAVKWFCWCRW